MSQIKSPFPGMDPYLEDPSEWRGVHTMLIVAASDLIRAALPANFSVKIEGAVKLMSTHGDIISRVTPDIFLTPRYPTREAQIATATIAEPVLVNQFFEKTFEHRWLSVKRRRTKEVVTIIEILSPFNKVGRGYEEFVKKRDSVMRTETNWLEIDLLRGGKRPFNAYPNDLDYYALMKRASTLDVLMWPMSIRKKLLTIGVPLIGGYDDVPLDLQAAIDKVYRDGEFAFDLDYGLPVPPPKLSAENQAWAAERIATWREKHKM